MKQKKQATAPATSRRFIPAGARLGSLEPAPPPLPDPVPDTRAAGPNPQEQEQQQQTDFGPLPRFPTIRSLRNGCYLLRYTPTQTFPLVHYDGTLRVERHTSGTTASGDLYTHSTSFWPGSGPPVEPNPSAGIPVFPRSRYRYYLRVTQVLEGFTFTSSFTLGLEMHRFNQAARTWTNEGILTAQMSWTTAPAGYCSAPTDLTGSVPQCSVGATAGVETRHDGWGVAVPAACRRRGLHRWCDGEGRLSKNRRRGWAGGTIFDTRGLAR